MSISSRTPWSVARVDIGNMMVRDPASLSLGYINPFKPRTSGKPVPMSLENEEEWNGLIGHVKTYLKEQQAKNRGKGAAPKNWTITLVDLKKDAQAKVCFQFSLRIIKYESPVIGQPQGCKICPKDRTRCQQQRCRRNKGPRPSYSW
jgi:hypothetical protein